MKQYDFIFSLGAACSCSQSLREAGLQFASYPFDWVGCPSVLKSVDALTSGFRGWFDAEDLKLIDVRREPLSTRCYINRKTGFVYYHEFSLFSTFGARYPLIADQFRRREERLRQSLQNSRSVLAVYVEVPFREQGTDADFVEANRRLRTAFPHSGVDLLVFRKCACDGKTAVREIIPGVTVVELDFVRYEDDVISHQVDRTGIRKFLQANFKVADGRSEAERIRFAECKRKERAGKWGSGMIFSRLYNEVSYKIYRRLERYLVTQKVIPREMPVRY